MALVNILWLNDKDSAWHLLAMQTVPASPVKKISEVAGDVKDLNLKDLWGVTAKSRQF